MNGLSVPMPGLAGPSAGERSVPKAPDPAGHRAAALMRLPPTSLVKLGDPQTFGFAHALHELELFSPGAVSALIDRYQHHPDDYFVARGAPVASTAFYAVEHDHCTLPEAARTIDAAPTRILLKRLETHSADFRALLARLMERLLDLDPGLRGQEILRLESALFITSARTTTPFHFDPETNFFFQIEGRKTFHVYEPGILSEPELEAFYRRNIINIGQVDLDGCDPLREQVFRLEAGDGLLQPQNAPHWVETSDGRSISYSFVFETRRSRRLGLTRSFNHYLRRTGIRPSRPGLHPALDGLKAGSMRIALPVRTGLWSALHPGG